ncbi:heat shock factor binding protein 1-domain-containing protein [Paraphysoderma sedebokerense]|nr:heat shock factor binding protein 1-domain-containing protein [Paraphysoderma sedebokerense]
MTDQSISQQQQQQKPAPADAQQAQDLSKFVETLLLQMQTKFEDMSSQILSKMDDMATRIDELEKTVGDLMSQAAIEEENSNVAGSSENATK